LQLTRYEGGFQPTKDKYGRDFSALYVSRQDSSTEPSTAAKKMLRGKFAEEVAQALKSPHSTTQLRLADVEAQETSIAKLRANIEETREQLANLECELHTAEKKLVEAKINLSMADYQERHPEE
jgi:phage shock protein A